MPTIEQYDYQRPPEQPDGVHSIQWYFAPANKKATLTSSAPWLQGPAMVCHYDKDDNLILTRFINSDGTYKDAT